MSYPRDLDDYTDLELHKELVRRIEARARGECDYCRQWAAGAPPCRYPWRHRLAASPAIIPGTAGEE